MKYKRCNCMTPAQHGRYREWLDKACEQQLERMRQGRPLNANLTGHE